jgi:hypothetical protein
MEHFFKIFSRTSVPKSIKLDTYYPSVKDKSVQIKDQALFKGEIITEM